VSFYWFKQRTKADASGTGSLGLGEAMPGFPTMAAVVASGTLVPVLLRSTVTADWEVSRCSHAAEILSRTECLASSNGGSFVDFVSGIILIEPVSQVADGTSIDTVAAMPVGQIWQTLGW
jgi:hypothetical protein